MRGWVYNSLSVCFKHSSGVSVHELNSFHDSIKDSPIVLCKKDGHGCFCHLLQFTNKQNNFTKYFRAMTLQLRILPPTKLLANKSIYELIHHCSLQAFTQMELMGAYFYLLHDS